MPEAVPNLHLCIGDKFTAPFVELVNSCFDSREHEFFVVERALRYPPGDAANVRLLGSYRMRWVGLLALAVKMSRARRIIVHGLFGPNLYVLVLQPWLLRKVHWMIWGGDIYVHLASHETWRQRLDEAIRRVVIPRIGHLHTWLEGDVDLVRRWYGARGEFGQCLMYTSNIVEPLDSPSSAGEELVVLVGNCADEGSDHLPILRRLRELDNGKLRVLCPLSYGDMDYAEVVSNEGRQLFGDRFTPLRNFLGLHEYRRVLASVDISVFATRRQQGMGNIISLLGFGKKVYIRDEVTAWSAFCGRGIKIHAFELDKISLDLLSIEDSARNIELVREQFSQTVLVGQLQGIFHGATTKRR